MVMQKYLDPKNDVAFKRLFGTEKNKEILVNFLNDVLCRSNIIEEVEFLPTINIPDSAEQRVSIVDVMCRDKAGAKFIIEMQVVSTLEYLKRAQYYAARAYVGQRTKEVKYKDLKEVIFLAICNQTILPEHEHYISYHVMLEQSTHKNHLKDFSYTFIELEKFNKSAEELSSQLDKWIYFFKHAEEGEVFPQQLMKDEHIHQALDEMKSFNWSEEELLAYEHVEYEHYAYIEGMALAKEDGKKIGEQIGLEKGKIEGKIEIAKKLKDVGMNDKQIAAITELTIDEISKIL
jgi:predicted transposase/invertase (TIGR01784 family)